MPKNKVACKLSRQNSCSHAENENERIAQMSVQRICHAETHALDSINDLYLPISLAMSAIIWPERWSCPFEYAKKKNNQEAREQMLLGSVYQVFAFFFWT